MKAINHANEYALTVYTLNNTGSLKRTLQYYHHAAPGEPCKGSPGVLHGNSTERFLPNNLVCLDCYSTTTRE